MLAPQERKERGPYREVTTNFPGLEERMQCANRRSDLAMLRPPPLRPCAVHSNCALSLKHSPCESRGCPVTGPSWGTSQEDGKESPCFYVLQVWLTDMVRLCFTSVGR